MLVPDHFCQRYAKADKSSVDVLQLLSSSRLSDDALSQDRGWLTWPLLDPTWRADAMAVAKQVPCRSLSLIAQWAAPHPDPLLHVAVGIKISDLTRLDTTLL